MSRLRIIQRPRPVEAHLVGLPSCGVLLRKEARATAGLLLDQAIAPAISVPAEPLLTVALILALLMVRRVEHRTPDRRLDQMGRLPAKPLRVLAGHLRAAVVQLQVALRKDLQLVVAQKTLQLMVEALQVKFAKYSENAKV